MGGIATSPPFTWSATFAAQARLVIGKIKTDAKSNEITAISELLAFLDIKACLVSIGTMGCQSAIISTIVKDGGNYLLVLKSNQLIPHKAVCEALLSRRRQLFTKKRSVCRKSTVTSMTRKHRVLPAEALAE